MVIVVGVRSCVGQHWDGGGLRGGLYRAGGDVEGT